MLFDYSLIARNFRRSITTWYLKRETIGPISELYFSTLRGNSMYSENRFLNLIQGLEAYHRQFVRNQEFPRAKYEKRKLRVLKDLPDSLKQWVSSNLSNEPSLRSRLTELVTGKKSLLSRLVPDTDRFINTVVETRRYYTHYSQTKKRNVAKPHELIHLIRPLTTLFEAVLLEELGLPKKKLDEIFTRRRRFQG